MEKQGSNNGGKPPRNPKKERVFGANALHLSTDEANKLVGGIIEKGVFNEDEFFTTPPSTTPLPSLLPFPVARHRSHGPHWAPNMNHCEDGGIEIGDDDHEEDDDPTNYDPIAVFAKPIIRKKKKELDLSRWREIVPKNVSSDVQNIVKGVEKQVMKGVSKTKSDEKNLSVNIDDILPSLQGDPNVGGVETVVTSIDMELDRLNGSSLAESKANVATSELKQSTNAEGNSAVFSGDARRNSILAEAHLSAYDDVDMEMENHSALDMPVLRCSQPAATFGTGITGHEQGHMSLQSQIDAENRTVLEKMSPEEIAEAQAEIKNRLNPKLLEMLKKRGLQKNDKLGSVCSSHADDVSSSGPMQADKPLTEDDNGSSVSESVASPLMATPSKLDIDTRLDKSAQRSSSNDSKWDIWSKRVEAVRTLRFLFDGTVIEGNSLDQVYNMDTVAERDFLRTEGDPGAAGYTIKEALALTRSVVPGQRALALHLLASILTKALHIYDCQLDYTAKNSNEKNLIDWEAIWAYALGPEPELALSLRLALDDNHNSVVLASAKVIQCVLACDINDNFFNRLEKVNVKGWYTAPVFRSRPDIRHGFLRGGFWKYSTKPSNIYLPDEEIRHDDNEAEHTIQDDTVVAGQDFVAGLIRMGILPRLRYLLETEPMMALEECILSVLVAFARHSPTSASAIWNCERLVQTIVNRFTVNIALENQASKIKSVSLLRVLSQSNKDTCIEFIQKGFFQIMTLQLFRVIPSIDEWMRTGKDKCKLASELMIEQLRFWKVCVMHGYCISYFTSFFPALCLWLRPSTFDKLIETNMFHEFASISMEVYLVLETLARRLPVLHSADNKNQEFKGSSGDDLETWCWNDVGPMIDMALKWLEIMQNGVFDKTVSHNHISSLLWVLSAVMGLLNVILVKVTPGDVLELKGRESGRKLPDFVTKVIRHLLNNVILETSAEKGGLFVEKLCHLRNHLDLEVSTASMCCLRGLFQFIVSADNLIQLTRHNAEPKISHELIRENEILSEGIFKYSLSEWQNVVGACLKFITSEWESVHSVEVFGRGGPAPGVGVGWGVLGGGFWSLTITLVQADARLLIELLQSFYSSFSGDFAEVKDHDFMLESINSVLAMCLVVGPGDEVMLQNAFDILLEIPVLKFLYQCIFHFLESYKGIEPLKLDFRDGDFIQFGKVLASHFRNRWLSVKKKKKPETKERNNRSTKMVKLNGKMLDTIPEDMERYVVSVENGKSLMVEWARQRLPLPIYWLLSPITTISDITKSNTSISAALPHVQDPMEFHEVSKAGLFFLLGFEAMSSKLLDEISSPVRSIPLIWKLHALSVPLLVGMGVLEEESSRCMYEALQRLYTQHLNELWLKSIKDIASKTETFGCLRFQSDIHDNYSTFIENLVEQFAAISYGDVIFARQIALYLHRLVDAPVRLSTWNALSNAHALELLPPLSDCLSQPQGYLEPAEEDEGILEAYVKSWVSGSLDRAATRNSMTYKLVLHHVSSFIFMNKCEEKQMLRKKLVKLLLRDYSRKQQHDAMMLELVQYQPSRTIHEAEQNMSKVLQMDYAGPRFEILKHCCEGNTQLLTMVEKLMSFMSNK